MEQLALKLAVRLGALVDGDELRVIDAFVGRLEIGRERYGALDLTVRRDWSREAVEERLDGAVYDIAARLAERVPR